MAQRNANRGNDNGKFDSDENTKIYCDLCAKNGVKNVKSEGFCQDCEQYFCTTCLRFHETFLPHHKQQDRHDMPKDICTETCIEHNGDVIKFYCEACDKFCCLTCKYDAHGQCEKVHFLPLLVRNIENSDEYINFENRLVHIKNELTEAALSLSATYLEMNNLLKDAVAAINKQKKELKITCLNALSKFETQIQKISAADKQNYTPVKEYLCAISSEATTLHNDANNTKLSGQRCKLYMKMKTAVYKLDQLEKEIEGVKEKISACSVTTYTYKPTPSVLERLTVGQLEVNGELENITQRNNTTDKSLQTDESVQDKHAPKNVSNCENYASMNCCQTLCCLTFGFLGLIGALCIILLLMFLAWPYFVQSVELVNEINEGMKVTDFCFLRKDLLFVCDELTNKLVIINTTDGGINHIFMHTIDAPGKVTKINDTTVAVAYPNARKVEILSFNGSALSLKSEIPIDGKPTDITYGADALFVTTVASANGPTLHVLKLNGTRLRIIDTVDGKPLFDYPVSVSMHSNDLSLNQVPISYQVYVLDVGMMSIIGITGIADTNLTIGYIHVNTASLFKSLSVTSTIDQDGSVYICCSQKGSFIQISSNLVNGTDIINRYVVNPPYSRMIYTIENGVETLYIASKHSETILAFKIRQRLLWHRLLSENVFIYLIILCVVTYMIEKLC